MITKISVENFKSFDDLQELSMISSTKIRSHADHRVKVGSTTSLLKYGVVYGANAAGKSNLVDFFSFFKHVLKNGIPAGSEWLFCKNRKENALRDSVFELQFSIDNRFYAYGFSVILSERRITGEWLYELMKNGNSKCIFERSINCSDGDDLNNTIETKIGLINDDKKRFKTYVKDFSTNTTSLFLSEMNRNKNFDEKSRLHVFEKVYRWLSNNIVIFTPNSNYTDFNSYYDDASLTLINQLIRTFDTGITQISIKEIGFEELESMIPKPIYSDILEKYKEHINNHPNSKVRISGRTKESFFSIESDNGGDVKVTTIRLTHGNSPFDFTFNEESDGTRRLFDLIDMLLSKRDDVIFIVDELERSLHPKLTEKFLELFGDRHRGQQVQLLFTTHESSIMDQDMFRRDEIWFIERNWENASSIFSLDIFKERYDKRIGKAYLEGRYGAIPVFSSFEFEEE